MWLSNPVYLNSEKLVCQCLKFRIFADKHIFSTTNKLSWIFSCGWDHLKISSISKDPLSSGDLRHHALDGKRPDGAAVMSWKNGWILVWDATCLDTFVLLHAALAAGDAGTVASHAHREKDVSEICIPEHQSPFRFHCHWSFWSVWAWGFVVPEGAGKMDQSRD